MSTLFQRTNGYYYIVVDLKDGSRRWISTKTKNRSAALRKLAEEESNPVTVSAMRLSEFKEDFLAYAKTVFSPGTNKIYRQALTHFEQFAGDICLDAVKPKHIDFFKSQRLKTVRPPTLNIELRTIRSAFYTAQRWGYIKENPFRGVKQCRVEEITPMFINELDAQIIIAAIRQNWMKDAVALALCTGLRCGELTNLRWNNVDFNRRLLIIESSPNFKTKGGKRRIVPINKNAMRVLERRVLTQDCEYVLSKDGKRIMEHNVTRMFHKYAVKLNLDRRLHFHSLRHSFASLLVQRGVSLYEVQKLMGHSNPRVTEIYSHLVPEAMHGAVEKIVM